MDYPKELRALADKMTAAYGRNPNSDMLRGAAWHIEGISEVAAEEPKANKRTTRK